MATKSTASPLHTAACPTLLARHTAYWVACLFPLPLKRQLRDDRDFAFANNCTKARLSLAEALHLTTPSGDALFIWWQTEEGELRGWQSISLPQ